MEGWARKILVLLTVLTLCEVLQFQAAEAQIVNECRTGRALCDINAFCIDTATSYYCNCKRGYTGDGRYGEGHTGCVKHRFSKWQVVTSIVGSILGALLILYCCIACIRGSLRARSRSAMEQQGGPAYGYPAQPYPPQQGIPMYPTNKVPPPAGVV